VLGQQWRGCLPGELLEAVVSSPCAPVTSDLRVPLTSRVGESSPQLPSDECPRHSAARDRQDQDPKQDNLVDGRADQIEQACKEEYENDGNDAAKNDSRDGTNGTYAARIRAAPGRELVSLPAFAKLGSKRGGALRADPTPSTVIDRDLTVLSRSTGPMNPIE